MSQQKVDRYKQEKANRKKIMKREKMQRTITAVCSSVVCIAVVGWLGYSAYGYFTKQETKDPVQTEVDLSAISDYMSGLSAEATTDE